MKKLVLLVMLTFAICASATTWNNVALMDKNCSRKAAANPDAHTRACALQCASSGYGIITNDGKFLKFDNTGDRQALKLIKATDRQDHLRVSVEGDEKDGTINVKSIKLD